MSADFDLVLDEALSLLEQGIPLAECLARYPEQAHDLDPLLNAALLCTEALAQREPMSDAALADGRRRLLAAASRPSHWSQRLRTWWRSRFRRLSPGAPDVPRAAPLRLRPAMAAVAVALALLIVVGSGLVIASAGSLPGDSLYPVKRAAEEVRRALTFGKGAREQLEQELVQKRLYEIEMVVTLRREVPVQFQGILESFEADGWVISGLRTRARPDTEVKGRLYVGATVWVDAYTQVDGALLVRKLVVIERPGAGSPHAPKPTSLPTTVPIATPRPSPRWTPPTPPTEALPLVTRPGAPTQLPRVPTDTPVPPTATHQPYPSPTVPTRTPVPPTETHEPYPSPTATPSNTPVPPTPTEEPYPFPTETPVPSIGPGFPTPTYTELPTPAVTPTSTPTVTTPTPTATGTASATPTVLPQAAAQQGWTIWRLLWGLLSNDP